MALATAQPAEVLRAWQKDDLFEKELAGLLARLLPPKYASNAIPTASILYKSLTTLKDLQTLGEEYSGIVQVDETYLRLPTYYSRLVSILLSVFGEIFCKKILLNLEKKIFQDTSLTNEAQTILLILIKSLNNMVPQIENMHRALSYIYGGPTQIGKTVTSIDYVQVRPAAATPYAHLRLLGIVTLVHSFLFCGQNIYQAKKNIEQLRDLSVEADNSKSCIACLEEMLQPCILQCGHIFCMQCCYGFLENCAMCRMPFERNTVVPLMNYYPGDSYK